MGDERKQDIVGDRDMSLLGLIRPGSVKSFGAGRKVAIKTAKYQYKIKRDSPISTNCMRFNCTGS